MTEIYTTSKGERKRIADLPYPYLCSALAKLEREQPDRTDEIEAMRKEVAERDAAHAAEGTNPRVALGGNMPPADPTPVQPPTAATFVALKTNLDDLHDEFANWADGEPIDSQAKADTLGDLIGQIIAGRKATEEARKLEAAPWDAGKKEVQDRYNPVIKRADTDADLGKSIIGKWEAAQRAKAAAEAEAARVAAAAATLAAAEAHRAAREAGDLAQLDAAEAAVTEARQSTKAAEKVEESRPVTKLGNRTVQMRTHYDVAMGDFYEALQYATANYADELEAFMLDLARKEVAAGKRQLPGITITPSQRAA